MGGAPSPVRPRVLHVTQAVEAGVAHVVADLVRAQKQAGWEVVVACPGGALQGLARGEGAEVLTWRAARGPGPGTPAELWALAAVLRRVRPDVVHLHSSQAGMVGRLAVRGRLPTVFSPHAWSWQPMSGPARRAAVAWERLAARWTHAIVCVSEDERGDGMRHGLDSPLVVIGNGVEADLAGRINHATQAQAREALGLVASTDLVVCCARISEQKGQADLLRAWPQLTRQRPSCELVLVGDGPLRAELELGARGLSGVRFVGWQARDEGLRWMRAATVVVCPSRYEAMSLVPLEAAALGTPVVATRVEGMMTAGLSADARRLVEPGDPSALAGALLDLLDDRDALARGSRQARAWARDQAEGAGSSAEYLDLYRRLLSTSER